MEGTSAAREIHAEIAAKDTKLRMMLGGDPSMSTQSMTPRRVRKRTKVGFGTFLTVLGGVVISIGLEIFSRPPCSSIGDCSHSQPWQLVGGILLAIGLAFIVGVTSPMLYQAWQSEKTP